MSYPGGLLKRVALIALLFSVAGCSSVRETAGGWFGGSDGKNASAAPEKKAAGKTVSGNPATTSGDVQRSDAVPPIVSATAGSFMVNTSPSHAKVYLDGEYRGRSPLRLETEPGEHVIAVKLEGYKMVTGKMSVRKGENAKVEMTLEQ